MPPLFWLSRRYSSIDRKKERSRSRPDPISRKITQSYLLSRKRATILVRGGIDPHKRGSANKLSWKLSSRSPPDCAFTSSKDGVYTIANINACRGKARNCFGSPISPIAAEVAAFVARGRDSRRAPYPENSEAFFGFGGGPPLGGGPGGFAAVAPLLLLLLLPLPLLLHWRLAAFAAVACRCGAHDGGRVLLINATAAARRARRKERKKKHETLEGKAGRSATDTHLQQSMGTTAKTNQFA